MCLSVGRASGLRVSFIDNNHYIEGVSADTAALKSLSDAILIHHISSEQFADGTRVVYAQLEADPDFACTPFVEQYPTSRVQFGIGVCIRRSFLPRAAVPLPRTLG